MIVHQVAGGSHRSHVSSSPHKTEVGKNVSSGNRGKNQEIVKSHGGAENSQKRKFDELSEHQSKIFEDILEKLALHFNSEETISSFCKWSKDEVPKPLGTWQDTKNEVLNYISEKTHQFVQRWENEENEFDKARVSLIQHCCKKYDIMEEEMREVAEDFLSSTRRRATFHRTRVEKI